MKQLVDCHKYTTATGPPSPCLWCQKAPEKEDDEEPHETPQALEALKAYLQEYGYLDSNRGGTSPLLQEMGDAIGRLQKSMGLPETKNLDAITYSAVGEPRCGHSDYVHSRRRAKPPRKLASKGEDSAVATEFAYFSGNPRWNSRLELTWALSTSRVTQRLSRDDLRSAFLHAFQLWAATVPTFRFTEVQDYGAADVKISFVAGDHGDAQSFDGVLGIIAHAFSPEDGRVHFDDAEFWSVDVGRDKAPQALDLTSVAIHEVGHVIGLAHSPVRKSVMFPSIAPHHTKRKLSEDDVQGVRQLYGLELPPAPSPHLRVVDCGSFLSFNRTLLLLHLVMHWMLLMLHY